MLQRRLSLADIALVVRQRASYAETIARVMREESLPCNIESRVDANDIPANRAALKAVCDSWNSCLARKLRAASFRICRSDQVGIFPA